MRSPGAPSPVDLAAFRRLVEAGLPYGRPELLQRRALVLKRAIMVAARCAPELKAAVAGLVRIARTVVPDSVSLLRLDRDVRKLDSLVSLLEVEAGARAAPKPARETALGRAMERARTHPIRPAQRVVCHQRHRRPRRSMRSRRPRRRVRGSGSSSSKDPPGDEPPACGGPDAKGSS